MSGANLRIVPDQPPNHVYTNLDTISGKVVLDLPMQEAITSISIKLEGMAVSQMQVPKYPNDPTRTRLEAEAHKILYVVENLFPPNTGNKPAQDSSKGFQLRAGHYEYPFSFKLPINNKCVAVPNFMTKMAGQNEQIQQRGDGLRHVTNTLPPSVSGLPNDEAWIRYFLKATVVRPRFYQVNLRMAYFFVFLPIEPPRPPARDEEVFARREHTFPKPYIPPPSRKSSIFSFNRSSSPVTSPTTTSAPRVVLEARLPSPPIIEPNRPVPLRLMVKKVDPFSEPVVIRGLQMRLISTTNIRTQTYAKNVTGSLHIMSDLNLQIPLGVNDSTVDKLFECSPQVWEQGVLSNALQPNFFTCNISRTYQLEVTAGISLGNGPINTIPLLLPVEVWSGIAPPPQLVERMQSDAARASSQTYPQDQKNAQLYTQPGPAQAGSSTQASQPSSGKQAAFNAGPTTGPAGPNTGPSAGPSADVHQAHFGPEYDAPPTYDEATATNIRPVPGPRREFSQDPNYFQGHAAIDNEQDPHNAPHPQT